MKTLELQNIIRKLIQLSSENEWVEFKENNHAPEEIWKTNFGSF